ncbi:MAG: biopolymer transporter ExbD [Myxococcales bacterium]|nr:biopolymer transporter ExbD [Myxococcales bacterium]
MDFDTPKREQPSINLSALIDIAFILVIFVVLAANFHRIRNIDVNLPRASAEKSADPKALVVSVPPRGDLSVAGKKVAPDKLAAALRALRGQYKSVLIVADKSASVQRAIRVLSEAQAAGFKAASIATQK